MLVAHPEDKFYREVACICSLWPSTKIFQALEFDTSGLRVRFLTIDTKSIGQK